MHKQLKKIGFFVSRNLKNEDEKLEDNRVKYLYKTDNKNEKTDKRKSRNQSLHNEETHCKNHGKRTVDSKKSRKTEVLPHSSSTEPYYPPLEDKRNFRRSQKPKISENELHLKQGFAEYDRYHLESKTKKKHDEFAEQTFNKYKLLENIKCNYPDDVQKLTEREILKLITNSKNIPKGAAINSSVVNKCFVFNKKRSNYNLPKEHKISKKTHHCKVDNINNIFMTTKQPGSKNAEKMYMDVDKRSEKPHRNQEKRAKQASSARPSRNRYNSDVCNVNSSAPSRRVRSSQSPTKYDENSDTKHVKKRSCSNSPVRYVDHFKNKEEKKTEVFPVESKNMNQSQENFQNMQTEILNLVKAVQKVRQKNGGELKGQIFANTETGVKSKNQAPGTLKTGKTSRVNKANPHRRKLCLVKNTFSIVSILPIHTSVTTVEKKKNSKSFKKYYQYDAHEDGNDIKTGTHQTYSDSYKLYQDSSDRSSVTSNGKKNNQLVKEKGNENASKRNLNLETHVSATHFDDFGAQNISCNSDRKKYKNSRIPVLAGSAKTARPTARPTITPRSNKEEVIERTIRDAKSKENVIQEQNPNTSSNMKRRVNTNFKNNTVRERSPSTKTSQKTVEIVKEKTFSGKMSKRNTSPETEEKKSISGPSVEKSPDPRRPRSSSINASTSKCQRNSSVDQAGENEGTKRPVVKRRVAEDSRINPEDSKVNSVANTSKFARQSDKTKTSTKQSKVSSTLSGKKKLIVDSEQNEASKISNDSGLSKKGKRTNEPSLESMSDTNLQRSSKAINKNCKTFQGCSTKTSYSNSTFGDKSTDSSTKTTTSFFVTKTYRDDDKLTRWQKSKRYADSVRKNLINKNQKTSITPSQVVEVRYVTVTQSALAPPLSSGTQNKSKKSIGVDSKIDFSDEKIGLSVIPTIEKAISSVTITKPDTEVLRVENEMKLDCFVNDLPRPCFEFVKQDTFNELFQLPADEALNDILHENYDFLKKDFRHNLEINYDIYSISSTDLSLNDLTFCEKKIDDWYDFTVRDERSSSDTSVCNKFCDDSNIRNQDQAVASSSAPDSEESGYSSTMSQSVSPFFKRPDIKALFYPYSNPPLDSYFVQMEENSKSLEIHAIESKSLQTVIECSQKSVQINLSEEGIPEMLESTRENKKSETHNDEGCVTSHPERAECVDVEEEKNEDDVNRDEALQQEKQVVTEDDFEEDYPVLLPNEEYFEKIYYITEEARNFCEMVCTNYSKKKKQKEKNVKKGKLFLSCIPCVTPE